MNIDESKVPTAAKGSIEAGYGPKHRGDSLAAADLGVKLSPEQDEVPPETDCNGRRILMRNDNIILVEAENGYTVSNDNGKSWWCNRQWSKDVNPKNGAYELLDTAKHAFSAAVADASPLVAIGPAGYTVDASGEPVDAPTIARMFDNKPYIDTYNELEPIEQHAFRQGVLMIKAQLVGTKDFDAAQATYEYLWKNRKTAGK